MTSAYPRRPARSRSRPISPTIRSSRALKAGEVKSDLVKFDFCGPKVANQGFKPMVREGTFDAGELAIVHASCRPRPTASRSCCCRPW